MGSAAYFGRLVTFESAARKNALISFGLFNPADATWLTNIIGIPGFGSSFATATQAFAATLNIDSSAADVITVTLTGNVTAMTFNFAGSATIPNGTRFWLRLIQDATGSRTVAFPSNLLFDQSFVVDPGANRATVLPVQYDTTVSMWKFFDTPFSGPTA